MTHETAAARRAYEHRNERLQRTIDVLADHPLAGVAAHGAKTQIAERHDLDTQRIHYVLKKWPELVEHRRAANSSPRTNGPAPTESPMPDGAGEIEVSVDLSVEEAFRAIRLLPDGLGASIYAQVVGSGVTEAEVRELVTGGDTA